MVERMTVNHLVIGSNPIWGVLDYYSRLRYYKIFTKNDNIKLDIIDVALVWKLPNKILKKLTNLKIIFSLGAGVDHILNLPSYQKIPIIRIKDPNMRSRMFNHVLSQILNYQLKLNDYRLAQNKQKWLDEKYTLLNKDLTIGVLGLGYIGSFVAKKLQSLDYKVIIGHPRGVSGCPVTLYQLVSIEKVRIHSVDVRNRHHMKY